MFRLNSKSVLYTLFFLLLPLTVTLQADDTSNQLQELKKKYAKQWLKLLLHERPDLAQKFLEKIKQKETAPAQQILPPAPVLPESKLMPEIKPEPTPPAPEKKLEAPPVEPKPMPKMEAEAPKPWMTDREKNNIHLIFSILETNAMGVYECLAAFFCKTNCQPYRVHITCLKSQLAYLHDNLTSKFPQTETMERRKIFVEFNKLASVLEEAEIALLKIIDRQYAASYLGAVQLGIEFAKAEPLLDTWNRQANAAINLLIRELKAENPRLTKLQTSINRMFHFGSNMGKMELLNIITHRLSN